VIASLIIENLLLMGCGPASAISRSDHSLFPFERATASILPVTRNGLDRMAQFHRLGNTDEVDAHDLPVLAWRDTLLTLRVRLDREF
jgi:hypothetical protein